MQGKISSHLQWWKFKNTSRDEPMYFWFILMQIWPQAKCQFEFNSFEEQLSIKKLPLKLKAIWQNKMPFTDLFTWFKVKLHHYRKYDLFLMDAKSLLHCLPTNGTDGFWFKISASLTKSMGKSLFAAAESLDRLHVMLAAFEHRCAGCCCWSPACSSTNYILYTCVFIAFKKSREVFFIFTN